MSIFNPVDTGAYEHAENHMLDAIKCEAKHAIREYETQQITAKQFDAILKALHIDHIHRDDFDECVWHCVCNGYTFVIQFFNTAGE